VLLVVEVAQDTSVVEVAQVHEVITLKLEEAVVVVQAI
jgi:hypothetical protein